MDSIDPVGDTFGAGPIQHDIVAVVSSITDDELTFDIKFAGNISQPSAFQQNVLAGFVDLDVDGNSATGTASHITQSGHGPTDLGVDFFVDLFSEGDAYLPNSTTPRMPGQVDLVDTSTVTTSAVLSATYDSTSVTVSIPLSSVTNVKFPINWGIIVGTIDESTDMILGSTIPEPATAICLILGTAASIVVHPGGKRRR
jgi:hypothetical protein